MAPKRTSLVAILVLLLTAGASAQLVHADATVQQSVDESAADNNHASNDDHRDLQARIVGGSTAPAAKYPYFVSGHKGYCGGR